VTLPAHVSAAQRDARIKVETKKLFTHFPILAEFSDERVTAQDRPWHISEMITTPAAAGPVVQITDRPLGTQPIICSLPFSDQICEEAFSSHGDMLCVPRQLAAILCDDMGVICLQLDRIETEIYGTNAWQERGCTAKMIVAFASERGLGCCILHGERLIETHPGPRPLCFTIVANHAYFYRGQHARRQLMRRLPCEFTRLAREAGESKTPDASEWLPYTGLAVGHFFVAEDQIEIARGELLSAGRHPRVVLKDESRIKRLVYTFSSQEHRRGTCFKPFSTT
jgi:hypothetical protein